MDMRWTTPTALIVAMMIGCVPQQNDSNNSPKETPTVTDSGPLAPQIGKQLTERVEAKTGVAKSGRRLDNPDLVGPIVAPARAFFRTKERMVFDIQIPQALSLYKASNGKFPETHEDFMTQIVKANRIKLPELPAGHRYEFDPEQGQLMVVRPVDRQKKG